MSGYPDGRRGELPRLPFASEIRGAIRTELPRMIVLRSARALGLPINARVAPGHRPWIAAENKHATVEHL
jgi:hypothetical protein